MKLFSKTNSNNINLTTISILPLLFFAGRLFLFLALLPNDLHGYGDFQTYFDVASLTGLPFFQYWTEYPPLYALSIEFLYALASGNQFLFDFILFTILTISGSISIWLFSEIAKLLKFDDSKISLLSIVYFGLLSFISYTWWYFDMVPVCLMMAALYTLIKEKDTATGIWLGLGILTKWFPILLLPAIFRFRKLKSFIKISTIALGMSVIVWGFLYVISPEMTWASLQSQPSRSSWQTVWALIDGNMTTGAFVPEEWRTNPEASTFIRGNPAKIPTWGSFIVFGSLGIYVMKKLKNTKSQSMIAFTGITWILFLFWSPGWSPQWILYLIPIILLGLNTKSGFLVCLMLILITYIEWPTLLSHEVFSGLWIIVLIRSILLIGIIMQWISITTGQNNKLVET